jgi:hypothetical protein
MAGARHATKKHGRRHGVGRFWRRLLGVLKAGGPKWRIKAADCRHHLHLGAHKTGTTFCQTVLEINRARLADHGIAYWSLEDTRRDITPYMIGLSSTKEATRTHEECLARLAEALGSDAARLVISDENLTGFIKDILRKRGYRGLRRRMIPIRDALGRDVRVFFTVRRYADFISSMYCEYVGTKQYIPFEEVRESRFMAELSWVKVYRILVRVFGRSNVVVFEYDRLFNSLPAHLACLVGKEMEFEIPKKQIRASPSARAIAHIARESSANPGIPVKQIAAQAIRLYPRNSDNPAFDPWTPAERLALDERYRRDLARIPCWHPH